MLRLADLLEANATEFAEIESVNSGRTLIATRLFDVNLSVDYLRYMAGWATKIHGQTIRPPPYVPNGNFFAMTLREPIGVVGAITPWNVPLGQAIWKIAPALASGCTIVLKPAEQTPLTALRFAQLVATAGIPKGVVNIVTGFGETAGAALVAHRGIDKLSFTGSSPVGRKIGEIAASQMKRCTLELGGKSPMVVLPDADLESTIAGTAMGIFANHGQNCCAGSRLFVHERIYDEVTAGLAKIASAIRVGAPLATSTEMGPLVSAAQQERVLSYIDSGQSEGAQILVGGSAPKARGSYVNPTIMCNVNLTCASCVRRFSGRCWRRPSSPTYAKSSIGPTRRNSGSEPAFGLAIWNRPIGLSAIFAREPFGSIRMGCWISPYRSAGSSNRASARNSAKRPSSSTLI